MPKNIILLGGSNSVMVNGLQKGLREGIEKFNLALEEQSQTKINQTNLTQTSKEQNQVNKNLSNKEIINGGGGQINLL